jgi:hypothetical protein
MAIPVVVRQSQSSPKPSQVYRRYDDQSGGMFPESQWDWNRVLENLIRAITLACMVKIISKCVPGESRGQSKNEAAVNLRGRDQKWIDEAMTSGPETPLTKMEMDAIRNRVLKNKK